jgi:preprotein translocase subunit SecA
MKNNNIFIYLIVTGFILAMLIPHCSNVRRIGANDSDTTSFRTTETRIDTIIQEVFLPVKTTTKTLVRTEYIHDTTYISTLCDSVRTYVDTTEYPNLTIYSEVSVRGELLNVNLSGKAESIEIIKEITHTDTVVISVPNNKGKIKSFFKGFTTGFGVGFATSSALSAVSK